MAIFDEEIEIRERAGGGAAPLGRAGPRVARYFNHHPAGSRGPVARG